MDLQEFFPEVLDNLFDGLYIVDTDRRIRYWNRAAEDITGFSRAYVTGRFCGDNILQHIDDDGRPLCRDGCPLHAAMLENSPKQAEVYLHHRDGHRVPVQVRIMPLREGDGRIIGAVETFSENFYRLHAEQKIRELENKALRDSLTGLFNRHFGNENIEVRIREFSRTGLVFGLMFLDVDNFKNINDEFGHKTGDEVLRTLARTLEANIRFRDSAIRWGGEEFIVIFNDAQTETVRGMSEKFLHLVRNSVISAEGGNLRFTVSAGTTVVRIGDDSASVVDRADRLMYKSKVGGKNRNTLG